MRHFINRHFLPCGTAFLGAIVFAPIHPTHAQDSREVEVKLISEYYRYTQIGKEVATKDQNSIRKRSITLRNYEGQKQYQFETGYVEFYDANWTLLGTKQANANRVDRPPEYRFNWLVREKAASDTSTYVAIEKTSNSQCGETTVKYTFSKKDLPFQLTIKGEAVTLEATEYIGDGIWTGSCGTGKNLLKIVYSPKLDLVLARDYKNFFPNGVFLNVGYGFKVLNIE